MLEAVLAAVFLDGGYGPAEQVLRRLLEGCWELKPEQDTRILLNELCQERFKKPARWGDGVMTGDAHMPSWSIEVHLPDADGRSFRGEAKAEGGRSASKDDAKRAAAAVALETLGSEG